MVPYQVESRRRHERRELGHELERLEQHVSRTVPPRMFQTVEHAAVGEQRQSLRGHRRPRTIAAKPLEALAIAGGHADIRMDVDTRYTGTPGAAWDHESLDVDSISDGRDALAGAGSRGDPAVHRRAVELGQERLIAPSGSASSGSARGPSPRRSSNARMRRATRPVTRVTSASSGGGSAWKRALPASSMA